MSRYKAVVSRPDFDSIDYSKIESQLDTLLANAKTEIEKLAGVENPDWQNFMQPQEVLMDELSRFWSPISHLNSVLNSDELRKSYTACLPKLSQFNTEMGQHDGLYQNTLKLKNGESYSSLTGAQKKLIDNQLRDFKLSGISLPEASKKRFMEISLKLSEIRNKFSENVLDATNSWEKLITDVEQLAGLPEHAIAAAAQRAKEKGDGSGDGWLLNLDFPTYYAVLTFADNAELRKEMYTAYNTRAADNGPHDRKLDNSSLIDEILELRSEEAKLLGFDNYAEFSVATKMVESPQQVLDFLGDLSDRSVPVAKQEMQELQEFANEHSGVKALEAWDISYFSDKLKQKKYSISEEDLKPYFPASKVIPGMFTVVGRLFGITINRVDNKDVWHKDVEYYEIRDSEERLRGEFYMDNYARENKRGGAWMDVCVSRMRLDDEQVQIPIAYLTCNLTPPVGNDPALLTHNEVTTLFHEFGHGLHHMLTLVDNSGVAGISGVEWDAVELPSQFLENWCWEREALDLISEHFETGEPLPDELLAKAQRAKNFQSAMQMVRQLEFATFDVRIHREDEVDVQATLNDVRSKVAVVPTPDFNRFQNGFSHIFAGGYAAGYFSYKWAEVLSADAFSKFEEDGIFNQQTGHAFMHNILEKGGTDEAMVLFTNFRGRKPDISALLRHSGLAA